MAVEPSPAAAATRLSDRGGRPRRRRRPASSSRTSGRRRRLRDGRAPVSTKPPSSRAISVGSQSVLGAAPMRMKTAVAGSSSVAPVARSRRTSPAAALPERLGDLAVGPDVDVRLGLQLADQVVRHRLGDGRPPDEDRDPSACRRDGWPPPPPSWRHRPRRPAPAPSPGLRSSRTRRRRHDRPGPRRTRRPSADRRRRSR